VTVRVLGEYTHTNRQTDRQTQTDLANIEFRVPHSQWYLVIGLVGLVELG